MTSLVDKSGQDQMDKIRSKPQSAEIFLSGRKMMLKYFLMHRIETVLGEVEFVGWRSRRVLSVSSRVLQLPMRSKCSRKSSCASPLKFENSLLRRSTCVIRENGFSSTNSTEKFMKKITDKFTPKFPLFP